MDIPLNELIPALDINKNVDMAILPGTPMVPNKPAIVIWYRNPLLKNSGVFAALNLNLLRLHSSIAHGRKITMASPSLLAILRYLPFLHV